MVDWINGIAQRLEASRTGPAPDRGVVQELAQHFEDRYRELLAGGADEPAARAAVFAEIEGIQNLPPTLPKSKRERSQNEDNSGKPASGRIFLDFIRDVRYGWRVIRRSPLFTLFAVISLGLGIGANTTVFTIINTLLLHPLPAGDASGVVAFYDAPANGAKPQSGEPPLSYANYRDYAGEQQCFRSVAAFTWPQVLTLNGSNGPERMFGELVTQQYFETLHVAPALGRFFLPSEASEPGSAPVAVLSYGAWQARFGGAGDVLGRTLQLNNISFRVIGVAPKGFLGVSALFGPDVWLPATMAERVFPGEFHLALTDRGKPQFLGVGRLREGFSTRSAQANLDAVAAALAKEYPETDEAHGVRVLPITDELYSGSGGTGGVTLASAVLLTMVILVLGIACSNVANLLMARAASRKHEIGVRMAIGAKRGRLVRQMLTESLLLSMVSCVAGLGFGYAGCRFVWSFVPAEVVHNMVAPKLDAGVLAFAVLVSLFTSVLFGLAPALRASRTDVASALKEETAAAGRGRRSLSFTHALLVGQVAFSLLCLITAALFFRSIERAYTVDPGFETSHLALLMMNPTQAGYDPTRVKEFYRSARERVAALPGIVSVSWASGLPFWNGPSRSVEIEGEPPFKKSEAITPIEIVVDTDYFRTMGIPLIAGRAFADSDREESHPVAIINQALAAQHWPGGNPLGERFRFSGDNTWREVVGVVRNANYTTLGEAPQPCAYLPVRQNYSGGMNLYVRSEGNPASVLPAIQREIRMLDSNVEVSDTRTGAKLIDQVLWGPRVGVSLLGVFGSLALLLASVGLYGVMAYSISRRRREIGLRMALGAPRSAVMRLVIGDGMRVVALGIALGLVGALLAGRALSRMLFGISSADPVSLFAASAVLIAVALAACYFPARSATRIDPMTVLRES